MQITVASIAEKGLTVPLSLETDWARGAAELALDVAPVQLDGELLVRVQGAVVRVSGQVRAVAQRLCERCGEPVELALHADETELAYIPGDSSASAHEQRPGASELRLGAADLDLGWYEGGRLDLAHVLSELLALELPSRIACYDVPACDARVERLLAAASPSVGEGPFAALRDLF